MLNEDVPRAIRPEQVAALMPWSKLEGCVVLTLGAKGKPNHLVMSSVTIEELALLTAQLQSHLNYLLANSLIEDVPNGLDT